MNATYLSSYPAVDDVMNRKLIFVSGKGGVGKTVVSQGLALAHSSMKRRTLWIGFEDPTRPPGEIRRINPHLFHLNNDGFQAFEEFVALKLRIPAVIRLFTQNRLVRLLSKTAPGIHEVLLLGKVWNELRSYDCLVVDMPSTGYGLAMFQALHNWGRLFKSGPLAADAERVFKTIGSPTVTGHLIVALPEEMPLRESLELDQTLNEIFPQNHPAFVVNRRFPQVQSRVDPNPDNWPSPIASSSADYVNKRSVLEEFNMRIWKDEQIQYAEFPFVPASQSVVEALAEQITSKGMLR